jgi:hypothetical protein
LIHGVDHQQQLEMVGHNLIIPFNIEHYMNINLNVQMKWLWQLEI